MSLLLLVSFCFVRCILALPHQLFCDNFTVAMNSNWLNTGSGSVIWKYNDYLCDTSNPPCCLITDNTTITSNNRIDAINYASIYITFDIDLEDLGAKENKLYIRSSFDDWNSNEELAKYTKTGISGLQNGIHIDLPSIFDHKNNIKFEIESNGPDSGRTAAIDSFCVYGTTTLSPTKQPTYIPTTNSPTSVPTHQPITNLPTFIPTYNPTTNPTVVPTNIPTDQPVTNSPTNIPTYHPTIIPTNIPTFPPITLTQIETHTSSVNDGHVDMDTTAHSDDTDSQILWNEQYGSQLIWLSIIIVVLVIIILIICGRMLLLQKRKRKNDKNAMEITVLDTIDNTSKTNGNINEPLSNHVVKQYTNVISGINGDENVKSLLKTFDNDENDDESIYGQGTRIQSIQTKGNETVGNDEGIQSEEMHNDIVTSGITKNARVETGAV